MNLDPDDSRVRTDPRPGWGTVAIVAAFYALCVGVATWPRVLWFRSCLPSLDDPLEHLWIMRWYKACLLEGRSMILCPEIQYPTGAPLGCFSPMHFQGLLYIPLSLAISSDIVCYNVLWMVGLVTTGLGTFLLAWHVVRDPWCAGFGGMLAMLSAPMLFHGGAQLELIYLGAFPLFLWTWIRLFEQPGPGRLAAVAGAYVLVALCTAYYAVYAVFPAALHFLWKGWSAGGVRGAWPWFRDRGRWLLAFAALVVPGLLIVFGNQVWAMAQGYALPRSLAEFRELGAPFWSYACPTESHALGRLFPSTWYESSGLGGRKNECCSYLGVVSLALLAYAAAVRVRFRHRSYWWACLAMLVVLAGGTGWIFAGREMTLPGLWLKNHFFLFRSIRAPARFNLFAAVVAAVPASCALQHLRAHLPARWMRGGVLAALTVVAVADLAIVPYYTARIPQMPGCYAFMEQNAPGAPFVEVPQSGSGGFGLNSVCMYWQSIHRGRTTAGYSGVENAPFDNLLTYNSPFLAEAIAARRSQADPDRTPIAVGGDVDFSDYAWLYLQAHNLRFVVVHRWPGAVSPEFRPGLDRLEEAMKVAKVFEDAGSIVYDRDRLTPPKQVVMITTTGWRIAETRARARLRVTDLQAHLLVYNPDPARELRLTMDASAIRESRQVRLVFEGKDLARWEVQRGPNQSMASPHFHLPGGLHDLVLQSDGTATPRSRRDAALENDMSPYSLRVTKVELQASSDLARR